MFLKNHLIFVFAKFLWFGLVFGMFYLFCKLVVRAFKKNVYVSNIVSFCFWLAFGFVFSSLCITFYDYQFCWFGLLGMFLGMLLVKISVDFFFTNFVRLLYNKFNNLKSRKKTNGKLQTS